MKPHLPICWILSALPSLAVPGALDALSTQGHADAWALFDYADDQVYGMEWDGGENPFIYASTVVDQPIWILADQAGRQTGLLGDYREVAAIRVEVYIDRPTELDFIDLALRLPTADGIDYVYSTLRSGDDFSDPGWYELEFDLGGEWFVFDGQGSYQPIDLRQVDLSNVDELGLRFFPVVGVTENQFYGVDTVRLEAKLIPERFVAGVAAGNFQIEVLPGAGRELDLERLVSGASWQAVTGWTGLRETSAKTFIEPVGRDGIFRAKLRPIFTELPAP